MILHYTYFLQIITFMVMSIIGSVTSSCAIVLASGGIIIDRHHYNYYHNSSRVSTLIVYIYVTLIFHFSITTSFSACLQFQFCSILHFHHANFTYFNQSMSVLFLLQVFWQFNFTTLARKKQAGCKASKVLHVLINEQCFQE